MAVDRVPKSATYGEPTPTGVSIAVGWVVMVGVTLLAAAVFPPAELPPRAFLLTVAAGAYAALVADLRAVVAVTALAMATFVGFLAHRFGELTGSGSAWSYAAVIALAAALGAGHRYMRPIASSEARDAPPSTPIRPRR